MLTKILHIPFSRLVVYLIILGLLPSLGISLFFISKKAQWISVRERMEKAQTKAETKSIKQASNLLVRAHYENADRFYIDQELETMRFLKKETEALQNLLQGQSYTGNEMAEKRYAFLTGKDNTLVFSENNMHKEDGVQELSEVTTHPVEIDNQDLIEILNRIEGDYPQKPQLIITDFKITRKENLSKNETFDLSLKLIKREFNI